MIGVACLAFGLGEAGAAWIDRLKRSAWFSGLAPREPDLDRAGGKLYGCWPVTAGPFAQGWTLGNGVTAFVASGRFPKAALATIAIPAQASQNDLAAARELVTALRQSRDVHGCRTSVVVTIEARLALTTDAYLRELLDRGAFVVQPGLDALGDHLHHFPLRAATLPRKGYRLICVDLADHLACWAAGSSARLHVIPSGLKAAAGTLARLSDPYASGIYRTDALNLHVHIDADDPGNSLAEIDELAERCRALFLGPEGHMVFTDADRMDGAVGSADLLIVHERHRGGSRPVLS